MKGSQSVSPARIATLVLGTFLIIFLLGMSIFLAAATGGPLWIVYAVSAAIGLATGAAAWRAWPFLTGTEKFYPNFILHVLFATLLFSTGGLAVNYFAADGSDMHRTEGVITRVYWEEHHRTQRVGRRTYRKGAPYKVYKIDLALPSGDTESFDVGKTIYDLAHKGDSATVETGRGKLGLPIINRSSVVLKTPRKTKNTRHCRFVGSSGGKHEIPDWVKKHHDVRPAIDPDSVAGDR